MRPIAPRMIPLLTLLLAHTAAAGTAWLVTTDYGTFGRLRSCADGTPWTVSGDLATIPGDAVARHHDGRVFVVGRGGANLVQVYEEDGTFVREFSLGAGRNPQDIAFDSVGEAYVSCYDDDVLLRVDVENGTVTGTWSTAAYADADGLPETAWITAVDDLLYVTCQLLDRNNWYQPTGPGQLLVFDMAAEAWLAPIDLVGGDPYTRIETLRTGGGDLRLRVGCAGVFGLLDGGIETVDPVAGVSLGYDVTEAQIGGDVTAFATTAPGVIHAVVSDPAFVTSLRRWQAGPGTTVLATAAGYHFADVAFDGDFQLFLADRTPAAPGLRVFDAIGDGELTTGALPTGLPPFQVVLPVAVPASPVPTPAVLGDVALGAPFPNPCNPRAVVPISGRPGATVRLAVCDLRGRRLLSAAVPLDGNGRAQWTFDGRDGRGRNLPAGTYRVVATGAGFAARTITLLK